MNVRTPDGDQVCRWCMNRSQFFRGEVDKYTWVGTGSSYLPAEVTAAFLWAQMEAADSITVRRLALWDRYHAWAQDHEATGVLTCPTIPDHCEHNAHMYYILLPGYEERVRFLKAMGEDGIGAVFHYIPLHSSPEGRRVGRTSGAMTVTDSASDSIVRLPLWLGLEDSLDHVLECADRALESVAH